MPRLYAFVVCEKVILDESGVASLIQLFDTITGGIPRGLNIPPNAVAPREWAIFISWEWADGDSNKEYTQFLEMLYPDNTPFGPKSATKFVMSQGKRHQFRVQSTGFPIGQVGRYTIRVWLEQNGAEVVSPQSIHINVQHSVEANVKESIESKVE